MSSSSAGATTAGGMGSSGMGSALAGGLRWMWSAAAAAAAGAAWYARQGAWQWGVVGPTKSMFSVPPQPMPWPAWHLPKPWLLRQAGWVMTVGMAGSVLTILYPMLESVRLVEARMGASGDEGSASALRQWTAYWMVYSLVASCEQLLPHAAGIWATLYSVARLALFAGLVLPEVDGAARLYFSVLRPISLRLLTASRGTDTATAATSPGAQRRKLMESGWEEEGEEERFMRMKQRQQQQQQHVEEQGKLGTAAGMLSSLPSETVALVAVCASEMGPRALRNLLTEGLRECRSKSHAYESDSATPSTSTSSQSVLNESHVSSGGGSGGGGRRSSIGSVGSSSGSYGTYGVKDSGRFLQMHTLE